MSECRDCTCKACREFERCEREAMDMMDRMETLERTMRAVAATLDMLADTTYDHVHGDEVHWMLSRVLQHPEVMA
ncbi:MAG: hypothetical protein IKG21_12950 [Atopobiaceae bacterium]|nr:hypothetical protein [Atopobiaceae bacterium]